VNRRVHGHGQHIIVDINGYKGVFHRVIDGKGHGEGIVVIFIGKFIFFQKILHQTGHLILFARRNRIGEGHGKHQQCGQQENDYFLHGGKSSSFCLINEKEMTVARSA
jgi:hypothetical protein